MHLRRIQNWRAAGVAATLFALAWPVAAQTPELRMLSELDRGAWELRFRSDGSQSRICLTSGMELIQLRHSQAGCSHFVVQDELNEVTVQYTCRGDGYGRTTVRREGNGLVQIRSRGIQGGLPFSIHGEARHTGRC